VQLSQKRPPLTCVCVCVCALNFCPVLVTSLQQLFTTGISLHYDAGRRAAAVIHYSSTLRQTCVARLQLLTPSAERVRDCIWTHHLCDVCTTTFLKTAMWRFWKKAAIYFYFLNNPRRTWRTQRFTGAFQKMWRHGYDPSPASHPVGMFLESQFIFHCSLNVIRGEGTPSFI